MRHRLSCHFRRAVMWTAEWLSDHFSGVLTILIGMAILEFVQLTDGLTVEHWRVLTAGIGLGLILEGTIEATVIPAAVSVLRAVQLWWWHAQ